MGFSSQERIQRFGPPAYFRLNDCAFEKLKRRMECVLTAIDQHKEHRHKEEKK